MKKVDFPYNCDMMPYRERRHEAKRVSTRWHLLLPESLRQYALDLEGSLKKCASSSDWFQLRCRQLALESLAYQQDREMWQAREAGSFTELPGDEGEGEIESP